MFITVQQIKAARALLDWDQQALADHAGLQVHQIRTLETERAKSSKVIEAVYKTFVDHGLGFIDDGVTKRRFEMKVLHGQTGFWAFYDDIYETVRQHGGRILVSNVEETVFWKWLGDYRIIHRERMEKLNNFTQKILVKEGTQNLLTNYHTTSFALLSSTQFTGVPFYLYGTKLAIINFEENDVQVFIIDHPNISVAYEKTFYALWDSAKKVGDNT